MNRRAESAFTLVELLVVIAIIGVLVALLLPAVQAARESGRRKQCVNHLRQMGQAIHNYHDSHTLLPAGGMCSWAGDDNSGNYCGLTEGKPWYVSGKLPAAENLPVGWAFQILPFIEEGAIMNEPDWEKVKQLTPSFFYCPSRRGPTQNMRPGDNGFLYGMMDYASATPANFLPGNPLPGNADTLAMIDFWKGNDFKVVTGDYMGMIIRTRACSLVGFNDVRDGTAKTLLLSEKFVPVDNYDGTGPIFGGQVRAFAGDDRGWSDGFDYDITRSTGVQPKRDVAIRGLTYLTGLPTECITFGSAHSDGMHAVFGDNSVHTINYDIDRLVFNTLGHRADGQVVDYSNWVD